jgi:hypothetical protein
LAQDQALNGLLDKMLSLQQKVAAESPKDVTG